MLYRTIIAEISSTLKEIAFVMSTDYNQDIIANALPTNGLLSKNEVNTIHLSEEQLRITNEIKCTMLEKQKVMNRWLNLERNIDDKAKDIHFCISHGEVPGRSCAILNAERSMINFIAEQREVLRKPLNVLDNQTFVDTYVDFLNDKLADWQETNPCNQANKSIESLLNINLEITKSVYQDVLIGKAETSFAMESIKSHL